MRHRLFEILVMTGDFAGHELVHQVRRWRARDLRIFRLRRRERVITLDARATGRERGGERCESNTDHMTPQITLLHHACRFGELPKTRPQQVAPSRACATRKGFVSAQGCGDPAYAIKILPTVRPRHPATRTPRLARSRLPCLEQRRS